MVNNGKDDKELNDYLKGNSELSNRYRVSSTVEPPAHLDENILSAAKEAVTEYEQKSKVAFHKSSWAIHVSIAAMITLSVSLVVTMQQETGQPLINVPESDLELYDSTMLLEEMVMPQTITEDDDMSVLDKIEIKQRSVERAYDYVPAPEALGAVGAYRTNNEARVLKNEAAIQPAKKTLLKEKARSEASEKRIFAKDQLLQSAPMEAEVNAIIELKQDRQLFLQDKQLMKIKVLWEEGHLFDAKQAYEDFIKKNPDITVESIKEIIGLDIYLALIDF